MSGRAWGAFFLILACGASAGAAGGAAAGADAPPGWSALRGPGVAGTQALEPRDGPREAAAARLDWGWVGRPPTTATSRPWQRRKSARVAMISSFLVPGLGQMYNEREFWAAVAAGFELYFIGEWISEQRLTNRYRAVVNADPENEEARVLFELHRDNRIQSTWMLGVTLLISGLQAFVDAHLHDFDETPLPVQFGATPDGGAAASLTLRF